MTKDHLLEAEQMPEEDKEIELDLLDLFGFFKSKIKWIAGAFIVGALLAVLVTQFIITPKYTATSTMYMVSSSSGSAVDLSDFNIGQSLSSDYAELIKTRPIIEDIIEEKNLDYSYEDILNMLNVSVVVDTRILKINVTSHNKKETATIANALALKAEKELPNLMDTPKPHIAETAIVPKHRSSPSLTRNTLIGAIGLMMIVLVILTIMYLMDDTIKSEDDLEKYFGIMPLTVIPEGQLDGEKLTDKERKMKRGKPKNIRKAEKEKVRNDRQS